MKYFLSSLLALVSAIAIAQAPKQIPYQGVARDAVGAPVANQTISLRLSIEVGPGVVVFQEEHQPTTNSFGLFHVQIGSIEEMDIDWGGEMKYLHVELDIAGGTNYVDLGTTAFLSVPYALYAESSGTPGPQGIQGEQGPQGPIGMTGPQGPAGINGADGQDGAPGASGPQGIQGEQGPMGPQGPAGMNGIDGQNGAQGPAGPQGLQGEQGPMGPQGMTGPQGPAGIDGVDGQDGAQGPAGPQGLQGEQGPMGPQGMTGPQGIQGIQGEQGPAGTGVSILGGFAYESELPATAMPGDSYLINGDLFVWSSNDQNWINVGNIQGPQGPVGLTGATGPQGPIGLTGPAGAAGPQGPIGLTGATGATGPQGPIGLTGPAGATGATGATGTQGQTGATGAVGPQGPIGLTGPAGATGAQGPIGLTGPAGATGATGAAGPQGPIGLTGPQGSIGLTGAQGPQGPIGLTGAQGPIGLTGPAGATGATGAQGPIGLTGPAGATGATGAQGPQGPIGLTGPVGATGAQGPIGLTGAVGATGATGAQGLIGLTGPAGATGPQGPIGLTGAAGPTGPQGLMGLTGATGAAGENGKNTLVKTTTETIGANCPTGGVRLEYGLDTNSNGTLEASEVNASLTNYVCNGAVGATGPQGVNANGINMNSGIYNFDGDLASNISFTSSGNVSGVLNNTTIESGAPMQTITVPAGKLYNLKYLYISKTGNCHNSAFFVDGYPLWGESSAPGAVDFWLHAGQTLTMSYGGWAGCNGTYSDTYYVMIDEYLLPANSSALITTGSVGGALNNTTIESGAPMQTITVPAGKMYNIKYLFIGKTGNCHNSAFFVDGFPLWGESVAPGEVNFWLHPGQTLTMSYGGWAGCNGTYNDSFYLLIHVFE